MMMLSENVRMGIASVRGARIRSFFTMLGIIIGVVSVITIVSLGEGVKRQISGQINELGQGLVTVRPGKLVNRDSKGNISGVNLFANIGTSSLTEKDVASAKTNVNVKSAASLSMISGVPSYQNTDYKEGLVIAASPEMPKVIDHEVEFGSFFQEMSKDKKVAVVGAGVAENLYQEVVPIGKSVYIRGHEFVIEGVFEKFAESPIATDVDFNNAVFIPEGVAKTISGGTLPIYQILVKPNDENVAPAVTKQLNESIKQNHSGQEDFTVFTTDETLSVTSGVLDLITRMIIGIAAVSLFVGGIGVMNVMLVSVSERTREIGIRKAIGATNGQIRSQFLIEAAVLSVWGVLAGIVISVLVNFLLRIVTDLQPIITWQPVVLAAGISLSVGIIFGVIPAIQAARKDPIDSLRPE